MCKQTKLALSLWLLAQTSISLHAQLFELDSQHENGWYSFSFSDGLYPVTFDLSLKNGGGITFNLSDVTGISVPEDWVVTNQNGSSFKVAYDGVFDAYPLGFETLEIGFYSDLSLDTLFNDDQNPLGIVYGPLVLENGYSPDSDPYRYRYTSRIVGYSQFYYDMPTYEGPQLSAEALIDLYGLTTEDIRPIAAGIELGSDDIRISLKNVIEGATYMLQFKENMNVNTWVNFKTFTHADLDENNTIRCPREGLSGFFRITLL